MSRIMRDIETMVGVREPQRKHGQAVFPRLLKRHPLPVLAHFRHCLVLTYAFPEELLHAFLPPGLILDVHNGFGFVAIAMVQTEALRPAFLPRCFGRNFFLSGYRIFARYRDARGRLLRGLKILRSETNRQMMAFFGNLLTHYNYQMAEAELVETHDRLMIEVSTRGHLADLALDANIAGREVALPAGSPFQNWREARLFAGPLPFTFDYEPESNSIVLIEGERRRWAPRPISVEVKRCTFFDRPPFNRAEPVLANAFYVGDIDYRWNRGVVERLADTIQLTPVLA